MANGGGWVGVNLDGTLAHYEGWNGGEIGAPVPVMVERVRELLAQGQEVRIVTARVAPVGRDEAECVAQQNRIRAWCEEHLGQALRVTCEKDFAMVALWDDRCREVVPNTGLFREEVEAAAALDLALWVDLAAQRATGGTGPAGDGRRFYLSSSTAVSKFARREVTRRFAERGWRLAWRQREGGGTAAWAERTEARCCG